MTLSWSAAMIQARDELPGYWNAAIVQRAIDLCSPARFSLSVCRSADVKVPFETEVFLRRVDYPLPDEYHHRWPLLKWDAMKTQYEAFDALLTSWRIKSRTRHLKYRWNPEDVPLEMWITSVCVMGGRPALKAESSGFDIYADFGSGDSSLIYLPTQRQLIAVYRTNQLAIEPADRPVVSAGSPLKGGV